MSDDFLELEIMEEDPSILDSLTEVLQKIDGVEYAGIVIEHPLTMKIIVRIKTNPSKIKARDAVIKAVDDLSNIAREISEELKRV